MATLPLATAFTNSAVTEGDFKTAITDQREFLAGLLGTDGTANTALRTLGSFGNDVSAKSSAYTVLASDRGVVFNCTSTFTLSLTAAATLGDGFTFAVINSGTGVITIDPNSTEQIDGANIKTIAAGSWAIVSCTGTAFITMGAVPATGALIGYQIFTASGTYTKATNNPSFVIVEVVGGGGGSSGAGGTSSFGTHCSATGGNGGGSNNNTGGTGSNGDLNLQGGKGDVEGTTSTGSIFTSAYGEGTGGQSTITGRGTGITTGGSSTAAGVNWIGGGGGGYSMKKILASSLASSETVTVGGVGSGTTSQVQAATAGIVIVWEYK